MSPGYVPGDILFDRTNTRSLKKVVIKQGFDIRSSSVEYQRLNRDCLY